MSTGPGWPTMIVALVRRDGVAPRATEAAAFPRIYREWNRPNPPAHPPAAPATK